MRDLCRCVAYVLILINFSSPVFPQMPDWFFFRDKDGNVYFYDRGFRIRITDERPFDYDPVTIEGADYCFNSALELLHEGKLEQALFYFKSIRLLRSDNSRVIRVMSDSTRWINRLYMKEGDRFTDADRKSTLLLAKNGSVYEMVNEKLFYKMELGFRPWILRTEWRKRDSEYGLRFGVNTGAGDGEDGYDYMTGIESRIYKYPVETVDEAENIFRFETGPDAAVRQELLRAGDRIIYTFDYGDGSTLCGVEGIYLNRNMIHLARSICHVNLKGQIYEEMKRNLVELVLVK